MKKVLVLLLSVSTLCALDKGNEDYPDQNAMVKPAAPAMGTHIGQTETEKMHDKINDFLRSEENKAIVDAVLYMGDVAWKRAQALFYEKEKVKYGNVSLALALGAGYLLGRRFSGIGKIRRQLIELSGKTDGLATGKQISELQAHHTKQLLELQKNIAEWMMKSKSGPTAP